MRAFSSQGRSHLLGAVAILRLVSPLALLLLDLQLLQAALLLLQLLLGVRVVEIAADSSLPLVRVVAATLEEACPEGIRRDQLCHSRETYRFQSSTRGGMRF
jgi:hypothetical protein